MENIDENSTLISFIGSDPDCIIIKLDTFVPFLDLERFSGKWTRLKNRSYALRIPYDKYTDFLDYIHKDLHLELQISSDLSAAYGSYIERGHGILTRSNQKTFELTNSNHQDKYGHDTYKLDINDYYFNSILWKLKNTGLKYIDSKSSQDCIYISTDNNMYGTLVHFLEECGVVVSNAQEPTTSTTAQNSNVSGNSLIDVTQLDLPFTPYPFQVADAEKIVSMRRALIGHEMGCGKTLISILVGKSISGKKLVVCPESMRMTWRREILQTDSHAQTRIVYPDDKTFTCDNEWTIIGYATAVKWINQLLNGNFEALIVDEAHKCKAVNNYGQPASKQAKTIMKLAQSIPYLYLLTGTPIPTRNKDLYNLLLMLGAFSTDNYTFFQFGQEYCDGHKTQYGWDFSGSSSTEKLHHLLSKYMVRRIKADVLPNLKKQRIPVFVDAKLTKDYLEIENKLRQAKDEEYLSLAMTGRKILSKIKTNTAIELTKLLLETEESVVIATEFRATMDAIQNAFKDDICCIRGGMSDGEKQEAIDSFQSGKKRVCCVSILAAGLGVTLTHAHNMIVCDFDWTPANMVQVEDRICRTGQTEPCNIYYLCHDDAILDTIFLDMITTKSEIIDKIVDNTDNTVDLTKMRQSADDVQNNFLQKLKAALKEK